MFRPTPAFGSSASTFGSSFGSTPNTPGFGSTAFGRTGFGPPTTSASTPFGTSTSGSTMFGQQPQTTSGGLFGSANPSSGFGAASAFGSSGGSMFNNQSNTSQSNSLFGSTSAFNTSQSQQRPYSFNNPTTSTASVGLFGSTTTTPAGGGSLFGATPAVNQPPGTTVKFAAVIGVETISKGGASSNIQTKLEVISAMKEYENKSHEELRVEDYIAGRKGGGAAATTGGFGFSGTANKFGTQQSTTPLFGQTSTASAGLFGAKPQGQTLFGTNTGTVGVSTGGFGTTATGGGLFSSSTPAFGQPTSSSSGFSFGSNTQAKPGGFSFGQTQSSAGTTGFGMSNTTSTAGTGFGSGGFSFGNNTSVQNQPTGAFGAAKPVFGTAGTTPTTGLFSAKPAAGGFGGFGTATASPFAPAPSATTGGLFGAQNQNKTGFSLNPTTGGFGTSTGFGTGGGLFGQTNTQNKTGGLSFGTGGGFGSTPSTGFGGFNTNTTGGGMFGSTPSTGGTMFGAQNTGLNTGGLNFGSTLGSGQVMNNVQNQQVAVPGVNNINNLIKALTHNPFGNSSLLKSSIAPTGTADQLLNPSASSGPGSEQDKTPSSKKPHYVLPSGIRNASTPKPISLNRLSNGHDPAKSMLFAGLDDFNDFSTDRPKFYPNVKKLGLKVFKNNKSNSSQGVDSSVLQDNSAAASPLTTPVGSPVVINRGIEMHTSFSTDSPTPDIIKGRSNIKQLHLARQSMLNDTLLELNVAQRGPRMPTIADEANKENSICLMEASLDEHPEALNSSLAPTHPAGIKLTRKGYYTLPSMEELKEMVDAEGKCLVENFTIGRYNYGNVCFLGTTDISGLDIDSIVFIVRKEVEVYPDNVEKPPVGAGLNKPAYVTLDCVWPIDKKTREVIKTDERLEEMSWANYLERQCVKMDSTFIEYRPETGSWVFKVRHFTKYGLEDEEEKQHAMVKGVAGVQSHKMTGEVTNVAKTTTDASKLAKLGNTTLTQSPPLFASKKGSGPPAMGLMSPPRVLTQNGGFSAPKQVFLDGSRDSSMENDFLHTTTNETDGFMCPMSPSAERMAVSSLTSHRAIQSKKSQLFFDDDGDYVSTSEISRGEKRPAPTELDQTSCLHDITSFDKFSTKKLMINSLPVEQDSLLNEESLMRPKQVVQPEFASLFDSTFLRAPRSEYSVLPSINDCVSVKHKPQHLIQKIPEQQSLGQATSKPICDAAAMMGRSFRVGWGPGLTFVHGGPALGSNITVLPPAQDMHIKPPTSLLFNGSISCAPVAVNKSHATEKFVLKIEKLHLASEKASTNETLDPLLEVCFKTILDNLMDPMTCQADSDDSFAHLEPDAGLKLLHCLAGVVADFGPLGNNKKLADIIELCVALWGDLDFYSPEFDGKSIYVESQARKEAVGQWLAHVSGEVVDSEVDRAISHADKDAYLDAIFSRLTARQIPEACALAQENSDYRLALLLAQACCGQDAPRQIMQCQLMSWVESRADEFISDGRMTLFTLLAGQPTHHTSQSLVNTCVGLDWRRCLALHLWYICPATGTVAEALEMFDKSCGLLDTADDLYCDKPRPFYSEEPLEDLRPNFDICYHLMKIYVDSTHKLESLLETSTNTADPMDVTTSWLVWCILHSLGYHSLPKGKATSLHISMASLLESKGHWQWASFVLMFIDNKRSREKEVCGLLERHILVEGEPQEEDNHNYHNKEEFILAELGIPSRRLYRAKATRSRSLKMVDEEAFYLLRDYDFNRAHSLIIDKIAPHAIVNEDHTYLREFLKDAVEVQSQISEWSSGGEIYWSYLQMLDQINTLKATGQLSGKEVEKLRPKLLALCSKLNNLQCPTSVHKVAVSEMSRVVVSVLRAILDCGADATRVLALQIAALPLTQECALDELNIITHQYLTSIAREKMIGQTRTST